MKKLQSLEMLRAIAALLVVMYHTQVIFGHRIGHTPFFGAFTNGDKGVDLFFVLSGFIITYIHSSDIGRADRLGNYAFSRFSRIYPAVWIMTAFAIVVYSLGFGGAEKAGKLAPWNIIASAFLLPQHGDALVNVTWTLKYELCFYFVFSLLILSRRFGAAVLLLWQLAVLAIALSAVDPDTLWGGYYLRPICLEFSIGIGCAALVMRRHVLPALSRPPLQALLFAVGVVVFVGGGLLQTYGPDGAKAVSRVLVYGLSAGFIILSLVLMEMDGRFRAAKTLVYFGGASYAIYLVHFSVVSLIATVLVKLHGAPLNDAVFGAVALVAVAAGVGFHEYIDQPIQQKLRRRWRERSSRLVLKSATSG